MGKVSVIDDSHGSKTSSCKTCLNCLPESLIGCLQNRLKCNLAFFGGRGVFPEIFHEHVLNQIAKSSIFFDGLSFSQP